MIDILPKSNSLSPDFWALMRHSYPEETVQRMMKGMDEAPQVSIRLNTCKATDTELSAAQEKYQCVPWAKDAYYLAERPAFTFDPLLHAGVYYVQEASSMFVEYLVKGVMGERLEGCNVALDLCAAPGGKSTLIRSLLPDSTILVSNEPMQKRAQVLAENMCKWGHPNVIVTQNYPSTFTTLLNTFDLIIADVPCSGEGMFRKDDEAIRDWSLANVEKCYQQQRSIISDVWPALKPGGTLIYSTCTFNHLEDEDNVRWICNTLGAEVVQVEIQSEWNFYTNGTGYHFLPGHSRGEGFYACALRKQGDHNTSLKTYDLTSLAKRCGRVLACGIESGKPDPKKKIIIPSHAEAMKTGTDTDESLIKANLTYTQAISYLRGEGLILDNDIPRGYVLVCYEGHALGWVKNIGNRANNLYPDAWRIRSTHITPTTLF